MPRKKLLNLLRDGSASREAALEARSRLRNKIMNSL